MGWLKLRFNFILMEVRSATLKLGIEIAKNGVAAIPVGRRTLKALQRRRGYIPTNTNDPEYSRGIFAYQARAITKYRPISGRLLEIGPGRNLGVAALFVKAGCSEAFAIDAEPRLDPSADLYGQLDVVDVLERVTYKCPMPLETASFPNGYFDLIVSHVVAEYFSDPEAAVKNIIRMLTPGGVSLHQIRLQGHWRTHEPSDFLRPSDRAWRLATSHRSGQPNRWRLSDWIAAFERLGAPIVESEVLKRVHISPQLRERLAPEFRTKSFDDLSAYSARILAIKPAATA